MSPIGAHLDHLQLLSPQPERLVDFYRGVMGMTAARIAPGLWACIPIHNWVRTADAAETLVSRA